MKKVIISYNLKKLIEKQLHILFYKGIKLYTASSGNEFLQMHKIRNVDLIITELDMPEMDDDKSFKDSLIIIVCDNNKTAIARCQKCGANTFMTKPIDYKQLLSKILRFLNIPERMSDRALSKGDVMVNFKNNYFSAHYKNISNSGMLLVTNEFLRPSGNITCVLFTGKNASIILNGEIVRAIKKTPRQYHYGIKFKNLSALVKTKLEKFLVTI
jgi:CheY-like chemotaxis protein